MCISTNKNYLYALFKPHVQFLFRGTRHQNTGSSSLERCPDDYRVLEHTTKKAERTGFVWSQEEKKAQEEILLLSTIVGEYREDGARLFLEEHSSMKWGNRHTLQGMMFYQTWRSSFQPQLFPNPFCLQDKIDSNTILMSKLHKLIQKTCFPLAANPQNA